MAAPDPNIGRDLLGGQFHILQKIGSGGMGSVYKASQPAMNRMVAVKILHPKLATRKDLVSRFRREARAMSHLTHPNTVKVLLYGELEDGSLYIVMEYLEGKNLNQVVRKEGALPVERAIPVLIQVCGALEEAHQLGIVHRDLKPENIFLSQNGGLKDYAKVLDFGLAKVTERELRPGSIMLTQEGMVFGTPEFMSPEQAQGKTLDARSDIYSLAVILYEVLTSKLPFEARTPMEYIQLHVTKPPLPLDDRVPGKRFPQGLGEVIKKALEKKPEDRYPSASAFAEALKPFAGAAGKGYTAMMPQSASSAQVAQVAQAAQLGQALTEAAQPQGAQAHALQQPQQGPATPQAMPAQHGQNHQGQQGPQGYAQHGQNPQNQQAQQARPMAQGTGMNKPAATIRMDAPAMQRADAWPRERGAKGGVSVALVVAIAAGCLVLGVLTTLLVLRVL